MCESQCGCQMLQKNFTCDGLSSLLFFNFLQDFFNYLSATVTNVVNNFDCGGLSLLLYFNFVHGLINYLCTIVTNSVKEISPAAGFLCCCSLFRFRSGFQELFVGDCGKFCKKWPAVDFRRSCIFILFMDFINYLCATVDNVVKILPVASFLHFCISISFTLSLIIICMRLWQML